jgi:nucleoside-diphosphate-sugar epimerase
MRIFLTGGTGLVGSHSAQLLVEAGHEVVVLCRADSDTAFLRSMGCTLVDGDVREDPKDIAPRMEGCTHVVHAAALVYSGDDLATMRAVNTQGTRNIFTAASEAGAQHALHVSSVAVYGGMPGPVDENTSTEGEIGPQNHYARSKREAEAAARHVEAERGIPVTILRPASVYGERDRLLSPRVARLARRPVTFFLGGGRNTISTVYAGNVAEAVLLATEAGRGGTTYDVGMDHPLTQKELLTGIAAGMGCSPRLVPIPEAVVRAGAKVLERLGVTPPGMSGLPLTRVVQLALAENPYQSRRLRDELGWDPSHRHRDALRRTGEWLIGEM